MQNSIDELVNSIEDRGKRMLVDQVQLQLRMFITDLDEIYNLTKTLLKHYDVGNFGEIADTMRKIPNNKNLEAVKPIFEKELSPEVCKCFTEISNYSNVELYKKFNTLLEKSNSYSVRCLSQVAEFSSEETTEKVLDFLIKNADKKVDHYALGIYYFCNRNAVQIVQKLVHKYDGLLEFLNDYSEDINDKIAMGVQNVADMEHNYFIKAAKILNNPAAAKAIEDEIIKGETLVEALIKLNLHSDEETTLHVLNGLKELRSDTYLHYQILIAQEVDPEKVREASDVFVKYKDYFDDFVRVISYSTIALDKLNYKDMLDDEVYESVRDSKNPGRLIKRVLTQGYKSLMKYEFKHQEMEIVLDTIDLIHEVHKKREKNQLCRIVNGFYQELDRAVNQGNDYNSRLKMLKEYCNDVQKQMRDNVDELMVITQ